MVKLKKHLLLHFMLFPIQFYVSLCTGCTGKRSGISVNGLRKFLSSEGLSSLCVVKNQTFSMTLDMFIPFIRRLHVLKVQHG